MLVISRAVIAALLLLHKVEPVSALFTLDFARFNVAFVTTLDPFVAIEALSRSMFKEIGTIIFTGVAHVGAWGDVRHRRVELRFNAKDEAILDIAAHGAAREILSATRALTCFGIERVKAATGPGIVGLGGVCTVPASGLIALTVAIVWVHQVVDTLIACLTEV